MSGRTLCIILPLFFVLTSLSIAFAETPILPKKHLAVPIIRQATSYSCGVAVVSAVLHYWKNFDSFETALYQELQPDPKMGTHPEKMVRVLQGRGLVASLKTNTSLKEVRTAILDGQTVILNIQAWPHGNSPKHWKEEWDDGHFIVAIAMDGKFLYAMDPSLAEGYAYLPVSELLERWHDTIEEAGKETQRHQRLAIFVKGTKAIEGYPRRLTLIR